jgi:hypothetical protein
MICAIKVTTFAPLDIVETLYKQAANVFDLQYETFINGTYADVT